VLVLRRFSQQESCENRLELGFHPIFGKCVNQRITPSSWLKLLSISIVNELRVILLWDWYQNFFKHCTQFFHPFTKPLDNRRQVTNFTPIYSTFQNDRPALKKYTYRRTSNSSNSGSPPAPRPALCTLS